MKTAPVSSLLEHDTNSSYNQDQNGNALRALSLQNEINTRYSTAASRYRNELTNKVTTQKSHHENSHSANQKHNSNASKYNFKFMASQ